MLTAIIGCKQQAGNLRNNFQSEHSQKQNLGRYGGERTDGVYSFSYHTFYSLGKKIPTCFTPTTLPGQDERGVKGGKTKIHLGYAFGTQGITLPLQIRKFDHIRGS